MTLLAWLFYITAPLGIFSPFPLTPLVVAPLALYAIGRSRAREGGFQLTVREWARAMRADGRRRPARTGVWLVSVWVVPLGLHLSGLTSAALVWFGAVTAYLYLGKMSSAAGATQAAWMLEHSDLLRQVLGISEQEMAKTLIVRAGNGELTVKGVPVKVLTGLADLEARLCVAMPGLEVYGTGHLQVTFGPTREDTEATRLSLRASGGLLGRVQSDDSGSVRPSTRLDLSASPTTTTTDA